MKRLRLFAAFIFGSLYLLVAVPCTASQDVPLPPLQYAAVTNMQIYPKPPLPVLGPAGYSFKDPTFGSRLLRVTDADTWSSSGPAHGASFGSPLYGELNAWNVDGTLFYIESQGLLLPYHFDRRNFSASRVDDPAHPENKLALRAAEDATFSYRHPHVLYIEDQGTLKTYDFKTGQSRDLVNLTTLHSGSTRSPGPLSISVDEKLCLHWGGDDANTNFLVLVYDVRKKVTHLLDSEASLIDGHPLPDGHQMGGFVHYAWIDKSGDYVAVMSTAPYQTYIWDLKRNDLTKVEPMGRGRKTLGYGWMINDSNLPPDYRARWLLRSLTSEGISQPKALIRFSEPFPYQATLDWNQAQPDHREPVLMTIFYDERQPLPWRPLADEIVAMATDGSGRVWRFAHHRNIYVGNWRNQPKGNVSQDGLYYLFTSNWENTLGPDRRDVFLLEMTPQKP